MAELASLFNRYLITVAPIQRPKGTQRQLHVVEPGVRKQAEGPAASATAVTVFRTDNLLRPAEGTEQVRAKDYLS